MSVAMASIALDGKGKTDHEAISHRYVTSTQIDQQLWDK